VVVVDFNSIFNFNYPSIVDDGNLSDMYVLRDVNNGFELWFVGYNTDCILLDFLIYVQMNGFRILIDNVI
jgi:hypothetical protein